MAVIAAARSLEHHGPTVIGGEGLHGVGHLFGGLLMRSADLHPGGLWEPGLTHRPAHGQLVTGQLQGPGWRLDADSLGLKTLQEGGVLVLMLEGDHRGRLPIGPRSAVTGDDGAHGRLVTGRPDGGVRGHLTGGAVGGLHQRSKVDTQSTGLLLHHAGQLPASDHGNNGNAHTTKATRPSKPSRKAGPETVGWRP